MQKTDINVAKITREELRGKHVKRSYSTKDVDALWEKVRGGKEWKERFGTSAESVMKELRGRGFLEKLKRDGSEKARIIITDRCDHSRSER